jgi:hypothetical protein
MRSVPFTDVPVSDWNDLASRSAEAWLLHRAEWVRIEERFFVERNFSFSIEHDGAIVGIQPLYLMGPAQTGGERLLCSAIHRHTGLALAPELSAGDRRAARRVAMERIFTLAEEIDADRIGLNAHNLAPVCLTANRPEIPFWVSDYHFDLGLAFGPSGIIPSPGMSSCSADQIVDLSANEEELFAGVDRTAARKGQKSGLTFRVTHPIDELDAYFALAHRSATRTGEALPPVDYYRAIADAFADSGNAGIAFAMLGDQNAAAIFYLSDKGSISYMAGVSEPEQLSTSPNDFVHWNLMMWAKTNGYSHYRLGPIFPEAPADWPIAKVSKFKSKWGGRSYTTIQGSYFRRPARYRDAAYAHLDMMFARSVTR